MADDVMVYVEGHPRGFRISLSLSRETVEELLKQVCMLRPHDLNSA